MSDIKLRLPLTPEGEVEFKSFLKALRWSKDFAPTSL